MQADAAPGFSQIYEQYKDKVFNTVISYVQNTEDAEEITQDVFLEVHRSLHRFEGRSSHSTWIYRISMNRSLDFLRARKRKKRFAFLSALFDPETGRILHEHTDFHHPGVALENKERAAMLFKAIDRLPDKQKSAFLFAKSEGLGNQEIAAIMELSVGAVESLLSRARDNLRKLLEKDLR